MKIVEFIFNSTEKAKPGFLPSSLCMFPESNGTNPNLTALTSKIQVFYTSEWAKGVTQRN